MKKVFLILLPLYLMGMEAFSQNYNEILGRPTDTSITVSVMFDQAVDVYIEYGTTPGVYPNSTSPSTTAADTPAEIDLQGLTIDTKYYYRTRYKITSSSTYQASPEHSFHTQRTPGSMFSFTVESDVHLYDKKGSDNLYNICLSNQAADNPDFMIDMGDTYGDDRDVATMTNEISDELHKYYRPLLGAICHSVPYYFCMGNHEGEFDYYLLQSPGNNIAVWGTLWRKFYYPNPYPNNFYSGNNDVEGYGMGSPENYYAWTWGDALFVVLDAYRYQSITDTTPKPQKWDWTLGLTQYTWFKNTLEGSSAKYKFVFIHQLRGQGRGGVLDAPYYEWGGYDGNGNYLFPSKRPGWDKPIHQLMVDNGVNILFHGHDHLFVYESLDSLVYLEVPMPSDSTYEIGMLANASAYVSDTLDGSGHIRVNVSPACIQVDFVRAYLPADTLSGLHHNREVAYSFNIGTCTTSIPEENETQDISIYPNPSGGEFTVNVPENFGAYQIMLTNLLGQTVLKTNSNRIDAGNIPNGVYYIKVSSSEKEMGKRVIICH